jgi:hypothetical protein
MPLARELLPPSLRRSATVTAIGQTIRSSMAMMAAKTGGFRPFPRTISFAIALGLIILTIIPPRDAGTPTAIFTTITITATPVHSPTDIVRVRVRIRVRVRAPPYLLVGAAVTAAVESRREGVSEGQHGVITP